MTAEPTTYATVFPVLSAFNQRGGMRWGVPRGEGVFNQFENTSMHTGWRAQLGGRHRHRPSALVGITG
jgi:hypothetical protein